MLKLIAISSATLLAATPLVAQTTAPAKTAPAKTAPAPAQPAEAQPAPAPAPAQATPAPAPAAAAQVETIVATEFPTYDADKSGDLNETEFQAWVVALRSKDANAPAMDDAAKVKWSKELFAKVDANKDKKVAQAEMVTFFSAA